MRRSVAAMAMDFTLEASGVDASSVDAVMEHVASDLRWVDEVFSTWREDSWISRLGRGEAGIADAPPAVAEVLDLCEQFRDETGGAFDARDPQGRVDPTGIVKTWAMERARWRLGLLGASGWLWGCGGDVTVAGRGPADGLWRIGIADPREPAGSDARPVRRIALGGAANGRASGPDRAPTALATSGDAHRPGHVWDPSTGASALHYAQVSVAGSDLIACDAWATAILAGGQSALRRANERGLAALALRVVDGKVRASATAAWTARG